MFLSQPYKTKLKEPFVGEDAMQISIPQMIGSFFARLSIRINHVLRQRYNSYPSSEER